jgi:hypothetical protein
VKRLLFVLLIATAFAIVSCGEKTDSITDEPEATTQLAKGDESPVSTCEGNVCTHEVTSSRECAVEGKCPGHQYAKAAEHVCTADCSADCPQAVGGTCMYAKERGTEGACQAHVTGKCTGECDENCPHYQGMHTCTAECPAGCPHAKAHVCTKDCAADCSYAGVYARAKHSPAHCPHAGAHVCTENCAADCPHASATGGSSGAAKATQATGCGGCPLKSTCKSGS